jgi:DNA-binding NarL/FixJ family response regulator
VHDIRQNDPGVTQESLKSANMPDSQTRPKKRVFLVDDHRLVREWLGNLINRRSDLETCGEADNARDALAGIAACRPDVAVVDLTLKDSFGLDLIKDIKHFHPNVQILVLTMHEGAFYAERAMRLGARGYVMKREATAEVVQAIYRILAGKIYISDTLGDILTSRYIEGRDATSTSLIPTLSDREFEVFQLLGKGEDIAKIAKTLEISTKTVHAHCARMRVKLNLESFWELFREAIQWYEASKTG